MAQKIFQKIDLNNEGHCKQLLILMNTYMEDQMGIGASMPLDLGSKIIALLKEQPTYIGFFVISDQKYVALANCFMAVSTFRAKPLLNIHDFVVVTESRKSGIGTFLLENIAIYAESQGCCKITLEVREDNIKAQNLYKKIGFASGNPPYLFWEKKLL